MAEQRFCKPPVAGSIPALGSEDFSMKRQLFFIVAIIAGVCIWAAADVSYYRYKETLRRLDVVENQMARSNMRMRRLENGICHEVNMRALKPSSRLSEANCLRFLDEIMKDASVAPEDGQELSVILTPTPTACAGSDQWCQIRRWGRSVMGVHDEP